MALKDYEIPQCEHIRDNGRRCKSPAMRGRDFCYYHHRLHDNPALPGDSNYQLPAIECEQSVQMAVSHILRSMLKGKIDRKDAATMFYGIQIAASTFNRTYTRYPPYCETDFTGGMSRALGRNAARPAPDNKTISKSAGPDRLNFQDLIVPEFNEGVDIEPNPDAVTGECPEDRVICQTTDGVLLSEDESSPKPKPIKTEQESEHSMKKTVSENSSRTDLTQDSNQEILQSDEVGAGAGSPTESEQRPDVSRKRGPSPSSAASLTYENLLAAKKYIPEFANDQTEEIRRRLVRLEERYPDRMAELYDMLRFATPPAKKTSA